MTWGVGDTTRQGVVQGGLQPTSQSVSSPSPAAPNRYTLSEQGCLLQCSFSLTHFTEPGRVHKHWSGKRTLALAVQPGLQGADRPRWRDSHLFRSTQSWVGTSPGPRLDYLRVSVISSFWPLLEGEVRASSP